VNLITSMQSLTAE